jgi:hypothetical protein
VARARVHLAAAEAASPPAAIEGALATLDALADELGSEPYRRIAALERARVTA